MLAPVRFRFNQGFVNVFLAALWATAFIQSPHQVAASATIDDFILHDVFVGGSPDQGVLLFAYVADKDGMYGKRWFHTYLKPDGSGYSDLQEIRTSALPLGEYPLPLRPFNDEIDLDLADIWQQDRFRPPPELNFVSKFESAKLIATSKGLMLRNSTADIVGFYSRATASQSGWSVFKKLFGSINKNGQLIAGTGSTFVSAYDWNRQTDVNQPHLKYARGHALKLQSDLMQSQRQLDLVGLDVADTKFRAALKSLIGIEFLVLKLDSPADKSKSPKVYQDDARTPAVLTLDRDGDPVWVTAAAKTEKYGIESWSFEVNGSEVFSLRKLHWFELLFPNSQWYPVVYTQPGTPTHRMLLQSPDGTNFVVSSRIKLNTVGRSLAMYPQSVPYLANLIPGDRLRHFLWGEPTPLATLPSGLSNLLSQFQQMKARMAGGSGNSGKSGPVSYAGHISGANALSSGSGSIGSSGCAVSFDP